jgi:bifunctional enzyme CysN/CysC
MSGAGKSTISRVVERRLFEDGCRTMLLDGDQPAPRALWRPRVLARSTARRTSAAPARFARLFFEQGTIVLCAFVSPYAIDRSRVRALMPEGRFVEVFVKADVETCRARDPKGCMRGPPKAGSTSSPACQLRTRSRWRRS